VTRNVVSQDKRVVNDAARAIQAAGRGPGRPVRAAQDTVWTVADDFATTITASSGGYTGEIIQYDHHLSGGVGKGPVNQMCPYNCQKNCCASELGPAFPDKCTDVKTDRDNCGKCGKQCGAQEDCVGGQCARIANCNLPIPCDRNELCVNNHCLKIPCDPNGPSIDCKIFDPGATCCPWQLQLLVGDGPGGRCVNLEKDPAFCGSCLQYLPLRLVTDHYLYGASAVGCCDLIDYTGYPDLDPTIILDIPVNDTVDTFCSCALGEHSLEMKKIWPPFYQVSC
jgi:hypothetical protein